MTDEFKLVDQGAEIAEPVNNEPVKEPVIITPEPEPVKRGRGRPKKNGENTATTSERKKKVSEKNLFDELREKGREYSEPKVEPGPGVGPALPTQPTPESNLLNGYLILLICDAFLPLVVIRIARARGNKGITSKQLKLTPAEKKELEPLADAAAAQLLPSMSPVTQFLLAMTSVYITKVV